MFLAAALLVSSVLVQGSSAAENAQSTFLKESGAAASTLTTATFAPEQSFVPPPPLKVEPLIVSGPAENRVDLVFFGDGYLTEDYGKFIADATRLAEDISGNHTFNTVRPLLNFWAAFTPSNERGIGVGGQPKDTVYGLYRDGTELRGVYYEKPEVADAACKSLGQQCDYPILLGNDPYYGGLGGDFTVITSSIDNGPLVLRHELGHSIIEVGEEYDGGPGYFGVNAAQNLSKPFPWAHWLTNPNKLRAERAVMPMQLYPWTLLNTSIPWSTKFTSSGAFDRHLVKFSLSALPEASDLKIELDGVDLGWVPRADIGLDRWHYDIHRNVSLKGGQHEIKFTLLNGIRQGAAQLCSVEILEFGTEEEYVLAPGHYSAYPTFSDKNITTYRPTNDDCLMRTVTSPNFCKVCIEGLWLSLLKRVNLVDNIKEGCVPAPSGNQQTQWLKTLSLDLVPLAQFRNASNTVNNHESYTITWKKDSKVLTKFANQTSLVLTDNEALGKYEVQVKFATDEVRVDKSGLLADKKTYNVTKTCPGN